MASTDDKSMDSELTLKSEAVEDFHAQPDHVLSALVDTINQTGLEIGITLHVSGAVVSGVAVSGRSYFDALADTVAKPSDHEAVRDALARVFRNTADSYPATGAGSDDESTNEEGSGSYVRTAYIHLRDAAVFSPAGACLPAGLWRGRLGHVSGWTLGNLSSP